MHRTLPRRAKNPGRIKLRTRRYILVFAGLLIATLALAAPAGAAFVTISASGSASTDISNLNYAISSAGSGGTVILNPGTYSIYNITVADSVTIRANTSYGHTAADTIIDGMQNGNSIFTVTGGNQTNPVVFDSLTMKNGTATNGGAISITSGTVSITSSTFTGCSATVYGGAIANGGTIGTITSSTFTGCSASQGGGAIFNDNGGTIGTITSSTFTHCQATGINSFGGAITNGGTIVTITSSTFTGCSATVYGGAIFNDNGAITAITSSTFTGCSAGNGGGAIYNLGGAITAITSSTFTGCSAGNGGGAIYNEPASTITAIQFNRFFNNTAANGPAMSNAGNINSATDNWWGTNAGASGSVWGGPPASGYSPWLNLTVTASPSTITYPQTALIQANLTYDSPTHDTASNGTFVPNGIPVAYSLSGVPGTLGVTGGNITSGANRTVFTPSSNGTAEITVTIDSQQVTVPVMVNNPIPLTGIGATTGTAQVGLSLTNGTVTPAGATVLMQWYESANINGPYTPIAGATGFIYVLQSSDLGKYIEANATGTGLYAGFANSTPAGPVLSPPVTPPAASGGGGTSRRDYWINTSGSGDLGYTGPQPTVMGYSQLQGTPVVAQSRQVAGSTPAVARQTVAAPPGASAAPSGGIPVFSLVAGIAGIGILAGGGFMVRRWWIRRQNPALFRKYD